MEYQILVDSKDACGENPLWHAAEGKLYWTDIPAGKLYRCDPATGEREQIYHDRPVGGFTFQREPDGSDALLLFRDKGNVVVWQNGEIKRTIVESIDLMSDTRFNDVIADPAGRVFAGTMPRKDAGGFLYRLDTDGSCRVVDEPVYVGNGMGFTLDGKHMYFTESDKKTIWFYDYDLATGNINNKRPFQTLGEGMGVPDGMTVDARGHIWSAHFGGSCVTEYDPQGHVLQVVQLPAKNITCPTFGGPAMDELFITSAGGGDKAKGEHAGSLFRVNPGVAGRLEHVSKIG